MKRNELEHIIRAAGAIAGSDQIVVLGSQAVLGQFPRAPEQLLVSQEADVYPLDAPDKADLIDGSIGEMSMFHEQFGYYAHGIGPEAATLADGWRERLVPVRNENTRGVTGLCLHPVDIAISKLAAGRPKDLEYVRVMLDEHLVTAGQVVDLLVSVRADTRSIVQDRLARLSPRSTS